MEAYMRNIVFTKAYQKDFRRVIQQYSKNKREGINKELNDILEKKLGMILYLLRKILFIKYML